MNEIQMELVNEIKDFSEIKGLSLELLHKLVEYLEETEVSGEELQSL